ncbi:MAG TPA: hypothetical protein VH008_35955 [Pseudonocardia sp.]|jgi:hypothetical protein|nr:hypothetical protein [Pseudonocardia sp.]
MTTATSQPSVDTTVEGFIDWLARRQPSLANRGRCAGSVGVFLRWQRVQRERGESRCTEDAYYAELCRHGASNAHITEARRAIGLFRHYLISTD